MHITFIPHVECANITFFFQWDIAGILPISRKNACYWKVVANFTEFLATIIFLNDKAFHKQNAFHSLTIAAIF